MDGIDNEISFLSDFHDDPVSLKAERFNNIIRKILTKKKFNKKLNLLFNKKDLIDNVERVAQPLKKRPNFRKRSINEPTWIVNNRKKAHESGQEHVNNKGRLIPVKKIVSKEECAIKCKFNCTQKIDRETQRITFMVSYNFDTNGKHSFIA